MVSLLVSLYSTDTTNEMLFLLCVFAWLFSINITFFITKEVIPHTQFFLRRMLQNFARMMPWLPSFIVHKISDCFWIWHYVHFLHEDKKIRFWIVAMAPMLIRKNIIHRVGYQVVIDTLKWISRRFLFNK